MTSAATPWTRALVTGASSGIGEAIARRLAEMGTDLVVVARGEDRLRALAGELHEHHGVQVEVLPCDLVDPGRRAAVEARIAATSNPVDLVVNNAGFGLDGHFWEHDIDVEDAMVQTNVTAVVRLTHAALRRMVPEGRGAVMNIASLAGVTPLPTQPTYSGTKHFLVGWGDSLHEDLHGTGVTLTTVLPAFTRTEFFERNDIETVGKLPSFAFLSSEQVARAAVADTAAGRARSVPGLHYKVAELLLEPVPDGIVRRVVGAVSRRMS